MANFTPSRLSRILEEPNSRPTENDEDDEVLNEYEILTEADLLIALELDPNAFKKGEYLEGVKYKQKRGGSCDSDFDESYDDSGSTNGHSGHLATAENFSMMHGSAQAKNMTIMEKFRSRPELAVKDSVYPTAGRDDLDGGGSSSVPTHHDDGVSVTSDSSMLSKISKQRRISSSTTTFSHGNGDELLKDFLQNNQGYEFDSEKGKKIFVKSILKKKYMAMYYVISPPQVTSFDYDTGGVATLLAVRNALKMKDKAVMDGKESVVSGGGMEESVITSCIMFDCLVNEMNFDEFTCLAMLNDLSVEAVTVSGDDADIKLFRQEVKDSCVSNQRICVCLYSCHQLFQSSGSSFALIGGYYKEKDLVLLFDPSRKKIPPFWIPLRILFDAMVTVKDSKLGYFLLEKGEKEAYILLNMSKKISVMLNSPPQHYEKLCDLKDSWESWLLSPQNIRYNIIDNAIGSIMEILSKESFKHASIHEEEAKLTYKQGSLVDFLTKTKTFPIIEKRVGLLDSDLLSKLTIFAEWVLETVFVIRKTAKGKTKTQKRKSRKLIKTSVNMNTFNNTAMLTTWLLFWPYNYNDDTTTNCAALCKCVQNDLESFPSTIVDMFHSQISSVIKVIESTTLHNFKAKEEINSNNDLIG